MDLESEEHRRFRASVRAFAEREVRPLVVEAEARQRFPRERVLPAMGQLGFFGIGVSAVSAATPTCRAFSPRNSGGSAAASPFRWCRR